MASDHYLQVFVRCALDVNRLINDLCLGPRALHAVFVGRRGIECLEVKILHIRLIVGEAPGDALVVADNDHRRPRQREAFHVPTRGREVNFVPDGGDHELEMRVVGQQGLAGRGMRAAYHPVVAAEPLANLVARFFEELLNRLRQG